MHPGMMAWWHARQRAHACGDQGRHAWAEHGHREGPPRGFGGRHWGHAEASHEGDSEFGGAFGVRRPLRFLAHKLELHEEQVAAFARVLDDLKTERAQAAVDHRRTTAAFADAISGETFDASAVNEAAAARVKSSERLRDAVVSALGRIHEILQPEQRAKLAYLLRTGALSM